MSDCNGPHFEIKTPTEASLVNRVLLELKHRRRHTNQLLDLLILDWRSAENTLETLICHITDSIQVNGSPVIYPIIEAGLRAYKNSVFNHTDAKYRDAVRVGSFIEALITHSCRALPIRVTDDQGDQWTLASHDAFLDWLATHSGHFIVQPHTITDHVRLRKHLYERITSENIRAALRRIDYEQTVVMGSFDLSN